MERYHIFKLGLAILFYAAYCVRPMFVNSLKAEAKSKSRPDGDYWVYFQGVDGKPGVDYPVYSYIPKTTFNCRGLESGYYADLDTDCQVFHICEDGKKISFLCPNGTIFQQSELICEWWNKVNCSNSPSLYEESAERLQNDIARRKSSRKVGGDVSHGAVMRTEQTASVRATKNGREFPVKQESQRRKSPRVQQDQQITADESNSRHLANTNFLIQNKHPNHNYESERKTAIRNNQIKKDVDRETGNYINGDQSKRQPKKISQNSNNNFESRDNGKTTYGLKEYHTQFGSTSAFEQEKTTKSYFNTKSYKTTYQSSFTVTDGSSTTDQQTNRNSFDFGKSRQSTAVTFNTVTYPADTSSQVSTTPSFNSKQSNHQLQYTQSSAFASQQSTSKNSRTNTNQNDVSSIPVFVGGNFEQFGQSATISPNAASVDKKPIEPLNAQEHQQKNFRGNVKFGNNIDKENEQQGSELQFPQHNSEAVQKNDLDESQIPQESSSFVKSSYNSIVDSSDKNSYPNHRPTYSDVKEITYQTPKLSSISSITPHLVTTQPINNGKPFVGSRVGSTISSNTQRHTYLPTTPKNHQIIFGVVRHTTTEIPPYGPPELFNLGVSNKTLPPIETTTSVTNPIPTEPFNVGNTDQTIKPVIVASAAIATKKPLDIYVPETGSLNVGEGDVNLITTKLPQQPVSEPLFVKKFVPLLYSTSTSTDIPNTQTFVYSTLPPSTDSATVYGTYSSATGRSAGFGKAVPIKFDKGSDRVSLHLSKSLGGSPEFGTKLKPSNDEYVRISASIGSSTSKPTPQQQNGFFITRAGSNLISTTNVPKKPRPFEVPQNFNTRVLGTTETTLQDTYSTYPTYKLSSARPFQKYETTEATPFTTTFPTSTRSFVFDNVDNMLTVLKEIANANSNPREGLVIPPSVSPQTLHSLAQYFASELSDSNVNDNLEPDTKEELTNLLTQMTVHGYNSLFRENPDGVSTTEATTTSDASTTVSAAFRSDEEVTEKPAELRQLARNFSLALSSYLDNPDNFKKDLENLRPTEPPPLEDEKGNGDDEILNFSDADITSSTQGYPSSSPTWGFLLATKSASSNEELGNSLGPDLHTADSQSFVPSFNNLRSDEKTKGRTELPPDHWTTSPNATKLWQKAFSVNPSIVNDYLVTTPSSLPLGDDVTTEPEAYSQNEALPKLDQPHSEISYQLRSLPQLTLNSTQVHGILLDFMNHSDSNEPNRLQRILKKLNTTESEFLSRMKEIESNPLTKRLILLLISECGANITHDLNNEKQNPNQELLKASASGVILPRHAEAVSSSVNSSFLKLVDPSLKEEDEDARALQLLNALYSIASRFGK